MKRKKLLREIDNLKREIVGLTEVCRRQQMEMYVLIDNKDLLKVEEIKFKYRRHRDMDRLFFFGKEGILLSDIIHDIINKKEVSDADNKE